MNPYTLDPSLLLCLSNVPVEHWAADWPAESTVMLRMTSKAAAATVDKMRLPVALSCKRGKFDSSGYKQLRVLSSVCLVTTLKLIDCLLKDQTLNLIKPLAAVLPHCRGLEHLDLSFNCIGDAGLHMLQAPIAGCTRLTKLVMSSNCFGDDGATRLAEVLTHLPALQYLDVSRNSVSGPGLESIAQALPHCPRISVLLFGHNRTANAVEPLAAVLPMCQFLTLIDVSYTDLGMHGLMIMFAARPHLRYLEIHAVGNPDIADFTNSSDFVRLDAVFSPEP
jgi:hypothetical protein